MFKEIIVLCTLAMAVRADNVYCDPKICPQGLQPHVACNVEPAWYPRCQEAEQIDMTDDVKQAILDKHNELRNIQASGQTPGYPSAKRMATMTWDDELANLAIYNVLQCTMEHDKCRSTWMFQYAGQNLYEQHTDEPAVVGAAAVKWWYDEYSYTSVDNIRKFGNLKENGKDVGHFTQVVKDNAFKVGCAMAKYYDPSKKDHRTLVACNYAVANLDTYPIYEDGPMASDCKSGTNSKYPALCSENEMYEAFYIRRG